MTREDSAPRHRILIIDDEESTRLLLARIISKDLKAEVQLAGTCEQAVRLAENYVFDAILLDLLMPGVGGFAVLKQIRENTPNEGTPVVVVSQLSDQRSIDSCMAAGASAYHVKPVRRADLVATVKAQLKGRRKSPTSN